MTEKTAFDLMKGKPTEADINAIKVALIMSFYHEAKSGNHERSFEFQKLLARELLTSISDIDNLSGALGAQPKDAVVVDTVETQEDDTKKGVWLNNIFFENGTIFKEPLLPHLFCIHKVENGKLINIQPLDRSKFDYDVLEVCFANSNAFVSGERLKILDALNAEPQPDNAVKVDDTSKPYSGLQGDRKLKVAALLTTYRLSEILNEHGKSPVPDFVEEIEALYAKEKGDAVA